MKTRMQRSIVVVAIAVAVVGGACSSDSDGGAKATTTAGGTGGSTLTLDAEQAPRLGREEGDEITLEAAPTTVVEATTTIPPDTQSASDQFIEDTLEATGLAEAEGDDYPAYTTFEIPGGYTAEAPTEWLSEVTSDANSITLNVTGWFDWSSSVNVRIDSGTPEAALASYLEGAGYDGDCTTEGTVPYDDGRIVGITKVYRACDRADAVVLVAGTITGDPSGKVIVLDLITVEPRDVRAIARLLATIAPAA